MSSEPCSSHVLDDSVIQIRKYWAVTGALLSFNVTFPPLAFFCEPDSNVFHSPSGPLSNSSGSLPIQYSTRYVTENGAAQAIRIALTDFCDFRSMTTHCG